MNGPGLDGRQQQCARRQLIGNQSSGLCARDESGNTRTKEEEAAKTSCQIKTDVTAEVGTLFLRQQQPPRMKLDDATAELLCRLEFACGQLDAKRNWGRK